MTEFENPEKFKAYMKKESQRLHISITNVYNSYFSRCILKRIADSSRGNLLIKGSSAETTYIGKLVRAITDVDLAFLSDYNSSFSSFSKDLCENKQDAFDMSLSSKVMCTKTGIYKLSAKATYGKINQFIGLDVQENYTRLIEPQKRIVPIIFQGDEEFEVIVPSYEEYLAEKLCTIIENQRQDVLNTRVKDFYDVYQLHGGCYDPDKLVYYFAKMIQLKGKMDIHDVRTLNLNQNYIDRHKCLWEIVQKKYDFLDKEISFEGAVYYTRSVLRELLMRNGIEMDDPIERAPLKSLKI